MPKFKPEIQYLLDHGWKLVDVCNSWEWLDPANPGAYYRLNDALSLQRSRERVKPSTRMPRQRNTEPVQR
jgi:hypothetical protein